MKLLLLTYGNLDFTKLAYESLPKGLDVVVSIGMGEDVETFEWAKKKGLTLIRYFESVSLAKAINDGVKYINDDLFIMGNDVQVYPDTVDKLLQYQDKALWVNSRESFTPKKYVTLYPEESKFFTTDGILKDFTFIPKYKLGATGVVDMNSFRVIGDSFNFVFFRKELVDYLVKVDGYFVDENFVGNGYFSDNDLGYRAIKSGLTMLQVLDAQYFHHHSMTMKLVRKSNIEEHHADFRKNKKYYIEKWGGLPGEERK